MAPGPIICPSASDGSTLLDPINNAKGRDGEIRMGRRSALGRIHHSGTDSRVRLGDADGVSQAGPAATFEDGYSTACQAAGPPVSDGRRMDHAGNGHADPRADSRADSPQYAPTPQGAAGARTATNGTGG